MFELGKVYSKAELDSIYKECSENNRLTKWQYGCTVDNKFFMRFTINNINSELWEVEEDMFQCLNTDGTSLDSKSDKFFTTNVMPTDRTKNKNYYTRYNTSGSKESWNPVSTIMGTGKKNPEEL